jgi:hypothetical protein
MKNEFLGRLRRAFLTGSRQIYTSNFQLHRHNNGVRPLLPHHEQPSVADCTVQPTPTRLAGRTARRNHAWKILHDIHTVMATVPCGEGWGRMGRQLRRRPERCREFIENEHGQRRAERRSGERGETTDGRLIRVTEREASHQPLDWIGRNWGHTHGIR